MRPQYLPKSRFPVKWILFLSALISLTLWACQTAPDGNADYKLSFSKLYETLKQYDSVTIVVNGLDGAPLDTVFKGKVSSQSAIENLSAPHFHGEKVDIVVSGFMAGELVYRIDKKYDGASGKTDSTISVVLQTTVLGYAGGPLQLKEGDSLDLPKITVTPEDLVSKTLVWSSSDPSILAVDGARIRGKAHGNASLTATLQSDLSKSVAISVTVIAKSVPIDTTKPPIDTLHAPASPAIASVNSGDAKATLSWNAVAGADSYDVYYAEGASVDKTGTRIRNASSPCEIPSLKNGTQYAFSVSATNRVGESALSAIKTATPQAPVAGAPVLNSVTAGDGFASVAWAAVAGATSYTLYYAAGTTVDKSGTKVGGAASPAQVSGLIDGTVYAFAVSATTAGGESALSNIGTATPQAPAPAAPVLTAVSAADAVATVAWSAVAGALSYNVYYKPGTSVDKSGNKITGVTAPATIPGLTNGTGYAFAVSVVTAGGESALSNVGTATPQAAAPGAPILSAVNAGDAAATVTWAPVTGAVSYNLYYKAGTTVDKTGTKMAGVTSPTLVSNLTNGTGYAFAVSAVTAGGESALSNIATGAPQAALPAAPGAPTISAANGSDTKVTVTWAAVSGASSYDLYYKIGTTVDKSGTKVAGAVSPATVSGLANGTGYAFAIIASNAGGESPLSNTATAAPQAPAPGAPVLGSVAGGNAMVTATWAAVTGALSYNLYYKAGTTVDKTGTKVASVTSPAQIASLINGTGYAFALSVVTAGGESALSNIITATPQIPAPAAPAITALAGDAKVTISWTAVAGAAAYDLYYKTGTTADKSGTQKAGITSPYVLGSLTNGTGYALVVVASNAGGESPFSNIATAMPQVAIPAAPALSTMSPGNASVTLTWAAVSGATSYNVYYKSGTSVDKASGTQKVSVSSPYMVTSLTNGTGYAFAVSAVNAGGESVLSNIGTATPQVAIPAAPVLSAPSAGNASVTLTWTAVSGAASYNVYYKSGTSVDKASGTQKLSVSSPYIVTSLANGTGYAFAVSAVNAGGESGLSNTLTATPQAPVTPAPSLTSATPGNGTVQLAWASVSGASSYNVYYKSGNTVDKSGSAVKKTSVISPYTVTGLTNDAQYAFAVTAVSGGIESEVSNILTAYPYVAGDRTLTVGKEAQVLIDEPGCNLGLTPTGSFPFYGTSLNHYTLFQFDLSSLSKANIKSAKVIFKVYANGPGWTAGTVNNLTAWIYRVNTPWLEGTGDWFWSDGDYQNTGGSVLQNHPVSDAIKALSTNVTLGGGGGLIPADSNTFSPTAPGTTMTKNDLTQPFTMTFNAASISTVVPPTNNLATFELDMTSYVKALAGTNPNGFEIFIQGIPGTGTYLSLVTKELDNGESAPKMIVTY